MIIKPSDLTIEQVAELQNSINAAIQALREKMVEGAAPVVARIMLDTPGLNTITLRGYTQAFNDGEPCIHGQDGPYLNGRDQWGGEDSFGGDREWGVGIDNAPFHAVSRILGDMDGFFEEAFGTNWELRFQRLEDGSISFEMEEYDCGY